MQGTKSRRNVMGTANGRDNYSCKCILNYLKAVKRKIRQAIEGGVTVVKFGREKRVGKDNSRIAIKRRADLAQLANMVEGGGTNRGDVSFEREIIVKDDTKVATGRNS